MRVRSLARLAAALAILILAAPAARAAQEAKPSEVVSKLQAALIGAMKDGEKLGIAGRIEKLDPVVRETHNFAVVARIALGKNWKGLAEEQRAAFIDKFSTLGVVTYAANFEKFGGESFKILDEKPGERGQVVVRSTLTKGDGGDVQFNYILEKDKKDGAWRIINIIVDGVSDLALKRAEYESEIAKDGFDALLKKISLRIDELKGAAGK